tara:strand:+ start:463 stop:672 length:210 start_codon:yes stop_codon:yes gene_type:complete
MILTEKERRQKLLDVKSNEGFYDLYKEVFKEEVPETQTRNPNKEMENICNAIYNNEKLIAEPLAKDAWI